MNLPLQVNLISQIYYKVQILGLLLLFSQLSTSKYQIINL